MASSNAAAPVLMQTEHSVLSGNYHRNIDGISGAIQIFIRSPEAAKQLIADNGVDYVHFCQTSGVYVGFAEAFPDGFANALLSGNPPEFLEQIGPALEDGAVTIYKVKN